LQAIVGQSPRLFELPRSRWWLAGVRQVCSWLQPLSLAGVHRLLRRLGLVYKRGRRYVHSPDLEYRAKCAVIARLHRLARRYPGRIILLYEDELTYYRKPTVGQGYAQGGSKEPRAVQATGYNNHARIATSVNALTGQTVSWQRATFDRRTFLAYVQAVAAAYPGAYRIYIVLDNWPVHFHSDVRAGLAGSRVQLVSLPTYAPWLNPVEKIWHKLYGEILHQHEFGAQWAALQSAVQHWLDRWVSPSDELLRYIGLSLD